MEERFATLRGLLASPPSRPTGEALYRLLAEWPSNDSRPLALEYAEQHIHANVEQASHSPLHLDALEGFALIGLLPPRALSWADLYYHTQDYLAYHPGREELCFLRLLPPTVECAGEFLVRYEQQLGQATELKSPYVLETWEMGHHEGRPYAVMEHVFGPNLRQVLPKLRKALSHQRLHFALAVGIQVARGLHAAHSHPSGSLEIPRPLLHGKLSPASVLLSLEGQVKVANFGLESALSLLPQTRRGSVHIGYYSPEQLRGNGSDPRSDIFNLGIALFEMLTGHHPFQGKSDMDMARKIYEGSYLSPRSLYPELPKSLEDILQQCLAREPEARFAEAPHLTEALESCAAQVLDAEPQEWLQDYLHDALALEALLTQYACLQPVDSVFQALPFYWNTQSSLENTSWSASTQGLRTPSPRMNLLSSRTAQAQPIKLSNLLSGVWRLLRKQ